MPTQLDSRQVVLRAAQAMLGSAANDALSTIFPKIDAEMAKLFEDRNVLLTDGGIITFTGTQVQFTEALNLSINQRVNGGTPLVISLGSTTRTVSASGRMIYAVIDRVAGTAVVTDDATVLPAVTSANQEVFLIAKRVDATDGTQRIYFRNGSALNAGQSVRLGASGSGSGGSGTGDDLNALTFKASFTDVFEDIPTAANSPVDTTAGKTDPTLYSAVNALFQLGYDASKTATTVGTAATMSGAPTFTVKIGDMLISGLYARRITAVGSQTSYTLEAAFPVDLVAAVACVSQAVYSKDLNNFAGDGLPLSTAFSTTINQIMTVYEDTSAQGDKIFDANTVPVIGWTGSSDGTNFTAVQLRPTNLSDLVTISNLPTAGTNLYLRFFANKTSGSGTVNILGYKTFLHRDLSVQDGLLLNQAYALLSGAGTQVNISSIGLVSGKTRVRTSYTFPVAVNAGTANGSLKVYINGQKVPRFVSASANAGGAYYLEIDANTIELDSDYSTSGFAIEIVQDVGVVDSSDTNTTSISQLQEEMQEGFQSFVKMSQMLTPTNIPGTPAPGTFYSSIIGRKSIPDLSADLRACAGVTRIPFGQLANLQDEVGPNGEGVWSMPNDQFGQIRFSGYWQFFADNNGSRPGSNPIASSNDFVEITFYGTGLNLLNFQDGSTRTISYSVDGGSLTALSPATGSAVLATRNYNSNVMFQVVSGLAPGIHTVKLQATGPVNITLFGVEIVNDAATMQVNPGTSYVNGKKIVSSAIQSVPFATGFESGTLGTRGGHVIVYQKPDGTIGKAVNPAGSQLNLTAADHSNEEVVRQYNFREFGSNRADDYSNLVGGGGSSRNFTLEDGTTILQGTGQIIGSSGLGQGLAHANNGNFTEITFVGTGLDVRNIRNATIDSTYTITVDQVAIATAVSGATLFGNGYFNIAKIVSGLPYGTHTVRFTSVAVNTIGANWTNFIVYQPKKPALPAGCVELADYNVPATFSALNAVGPDAVSVGVIRKHNAREVKYIGTWTYSQSTSNVGGGIAQTSTNADYAEYSFWGTGVDFRFASTASSHTFTISMDGSTNLSGFTTASNGSGITSFTAATGTVVTSTTGASANRVSITGLTLGMHTIRITRTGGTGPITPEAFDIITPIHAQKSDTPFDVGNSLPVGNQNAADSRKFSPEKDITFSKVTTQVFGIQISPTTTSTSFIPMPDMYSVVRSNGGMFEISWALSISNSGNNENRFRVYVNGIPVSPQKSGGMGATVQGVSDSFYVYLPPGVHHVALYWFTGAGTATLNGDMRTMSVREM